MFIVAYVAAYLGIAVFLVASLVRIASWARMPMHVRWELYPVAHEAERSHYGGSYLEESDWWRKPRHSSVVGELKVMLPEILFLVALKEHNPKLWLRSFPFHFGLYLLIGCSVLMAGNGLLAYAEVALLSGTLGTMLHYGIVGLAYAGLCLGLLGAVGLLHRRIFDPSLREFAAPADIFNLVFFIVAFGVALANVVLVDPNLVRSMTFAQALVTFSLVELTGTPLESALAYGSVILLGLLVAYVPLTHMSHFIGKYFAYHAIRWNDAPNLQGGPQEKAIHELLNKPVSWAGPHIQGGKSKTWADLATEEIKQ